MKKLFMDWYNSFNNAATGWSRKKITAFQCTITGFCIPVVLWAIWAYKHSDWALLTPVLGISTAFISVLFGINVVDKVKNPTETTDKSQPTDKAQ